MIRMKKLFVAFAGGMMCLMSCDRAEDLSQNYSNEFNLKCAKTAWTQDSRVVTDDTGGGGFSDNDCIELQVVAGDVVSDSQLQYVSGCWTPSLNRSDYAQGALTLSALFPVLPQGREKSSRTLNLPLDQSSSTGKVETDVLFAKTTANTTDASATLYFKHALHRINIQLKGNVPDDLKIEVRSCTKGEISLVDGAVSVSENDYSWITPQQKDKYTYSAIILPQSAKVYQSGEGLIRLTSEGKSTTYLLNSDILSFTSGMQTTLNLTLKAAEVSEVDTDFANQSRWVYGIDSPAYPGKENLRTMPITTWITEYPKGEWFRYGYDAIGLLDEVEYLTWKEGCGWYDCNKSFEYKKGDGNLCWAATASNLLHWWLEHNRKYVEAYETKYPGNPCPKEYRQMTEDNQNHSEVFNFFKKSFPNLGSWETGGVNWFINGDGRNLTVNSNKDFTGFFDKVFSRDNAVATETRNMSKENFNHWMKEAFRTNKAIGFSVFGFANAGSGMHAMTIWGAEFDADGNVAYLYFCDNNESETDPNYGAIKRYKVIYKLATSTDNTRETFLTPLDNIEGTPSKWQSTVCSLTLVDLRQDIWQKAFPEIK